LNPLKANSATVQCDTAVADQSSGLFCPWICP
jgi:hypothetical protein